MLITSSMGSKASLSLMLNPDAEEIIVDSTNDDTAV